MRENSKGHSPSISLFEFSWLFSGKAPQLPAAAVFGPSAPFLLSSSRPGLTIFQGTGFQVMPSCAGPIAPSPCTLVVLNKGQLATQSSNWCHGGCTSSTGSTWLPSSSPWGSVTPDYAAAKRPLRGPSCERGLRLCVMSSALHCPHELCQNILLRPDTETTRFWSA